MASKAHAVSTLNEYLAKHGSPIRYGYVPKSWPADYYQTVFATETGSAEMPSAGRAFTPELVTQLIARGVQFAPLILHTGVASLEDHEPPYAEYFRVPVETARAVNAARAAGKRVIAVGTTAIRALETVTDIGGHTHSGEGWTEIVITPQRGVRAVDGLLTGFHEPRATHLSMLQALAGQCDCDELRANPAAESDLRACLAVAGNEHLRIAYAEALKEKYLWHEFGRLAFDSPSARFRHGPISWPRGLSTQNTKWRQPEDFFAHLSNYSQAVRLSSEGCSWPA